jgi:hypothetical protein
MAMRDDFLRGFGDIGQQRRHELIAPFADLATDFVLLDPMAIIAEGFFPGLDVEIVGIHQRSVNIEEHSFQGHDLAYGEGSSLKNARK